MPSKTEMPGFKYATKLAEASIDGRDLPYMYDLVQQKSRDNSDDPSIDDPGAEASDDGDFTVEPPLLGHTGIKVNISEPNTSGSYTKGPEIKNLWADGNAPEGTRLAAKNVTGYIVDVLPPIPEANRVIGTFGDIDDI